jgi:hypothetical protein
MKSVAACLLLVLVALLPACREKPKQTIEPAPSAAPPPPPDQVVPGELAEGTIDAFGFKFPRVMKLDTRFPDAAFASGEASHKDVVNYVRNRVIASKVETLQVKTVFEGVTLKAATENKLHIEVIALGSGRSRLVVRDETRPPAKPGLTEEERWREVGMTPQGELIDPSHLD